MMFALGWIAGAVCGVVATLLTLSLTQHGASGRHRGDEPDRRGADRDAVAWR